MGRAWLTDGGKEPYPDEREEREKNLLGEDRRAEHVVEESEAGRGRSDYRHDQEPEGDGEPPGMD
jgi:hypothetical protein